MLRLYQPRKIVREENTPKIMWENFNHTFLSLQSSYFILLQNWYFFLYLLILQCAFAALISSFLSEIVVDKNSLSILSFLGGILGVTLFSLSAVLLKIKPSLSLGMAVGVAALMVMIWRRRYLNILLPMLGVVLFFLFILLLRLIFIQDLLVPPYADSVTHLQIVQDFMNPEHSPRAFYHLALDLEHTYHFGFHALAAWLSGSTSTDPSQTILILGQYFQALAVLAIYPLAYILSKNLISAWTVMSIAGLLLPTPSYASNWGKYPAIASMIGIAFVLTLFLIYLKNKSNYSPKIWWLIGLGILSTACLHSRSILVFCLVAFIIYLCFRSYFLRNILITKEKTNDYEETMALVLSIFLLVFIIIVLEFEVSFWLFLFFLILAALAFYADFVLSSILTIMVLMMGISHYIPMQWLALPTRFSTLFDRPFLVIFFYLPASLLVWRGLEGGIRLLSEDKFESLQRWLFVGILALGFINAIFIQDHYPSDCCVFLNDDDLFSFEWMRQNLPEDALVGIAATGQPGNYLPADGGAWIEHFTGISTRKLDSNADFFTETSSLCAEGVTYFYLDDLADSFDEYNLIQAGGIYQFGLGSVRIYSLDCGFLK